METAKEGDEFLATGSVDRQLQSCLDSFSTTVRKVRTCRSLQRHDLVELLRELWHRRIVIVGATDVNQLRRLILNRTHDFGMTMTSRTDSHAGVTVEEQISINVFDPNALPTFRHQFEVGSRIRGIYELRVGFDDRAGLWSGKFGFYIRGS